MLDRPESVYTKSNWIGFKPILMFKIFIFLGLRVSSSNWFQHSSSSFKYRSKQI